MPGVDLSKCVFITGGTAGIGRALGYKIKDLPNKPQVIMAGRRQERLDELSKDGFETIRMDLGKDRALLQKEAEQLLARYPEASHVPLPNSEGLWTEWLSLFKVRYYHPQCWNAERSPFCKRNRPRQQVISPLFMY
jgi:hypothetical protein